MATNEQTSNSTNAGGTNTAATTTADTNGGRPIHSTPTTAQTPVPAQHNPGGTNTAATMTTATNGARRIPPAHIQTPTTAPAPAPTPVTAPTPAPTPVPAQPAPSPVLQTWPNTETPAGSSALHAAIAGGRPVSLPHPYPHPANHGDDSPVAARVDQPMLLTLQKMSTLDEDTGIRSCAEANLNTNKL